MSKEKVDLTKIVAIAAIAIVLIAAVIGLGTQPKEINVYNTGEENLNLLSVNSTVTKDFAPDQVEITLSVKTLSTDATTSAQDNANKTKEVMDALKLVGVKNSEIETLNYNIYQKYEWDENLRKSVAKGYQTTNTIKITTNNLDNAGKIVDASVKAGVNDVSNIVFTLSKDKQAEAKQIVLKEASSMAKTKANNIASGLGVTVGEVHSISESTDYYTPNFYAYDSLTKAAAEGSIETPISAGDVSVSATVSVQFEI